MKTFEEIFDAWDVHPSILGKTATTDCGACTHPDQPRLGSLRSCDVSQGCTLKMVEGFNLLHSICSRLTQLEVLLDEGDSNLTTFALVPPSYEYADLSAYTSPRNLLLLVEQAIVSRLRTAPWAREMYLSRLGLDSTEGPLTLVRPLWGVEWPRPVSRLSRAFVGHATDKVLIVPSAGVKETDPSGRRGSFWGIASEMSAVFKLEDLPPSFLSTFRVLSEEMGFYDAFHASRLL